MVGSGLLLVVASRPVRRWYLCHQVLYDSCNCFFKVPMFILSSVVVFVSLVVLMSMLVCWWISVTICWWFLAVVSVGLVDRFLLRLVLFPLGLCFGVSQLFCSFLR